MQAIQLTKYGKPEEGLHVAEIAEPDDPKPSEMLIRGIQEVDWTNSQITAGGTVFQPIAKVPIARPPGESATPSTVKRTAAGHTLPGDFN